MLHREHVLGFDAREMWLSPAGDSHRSGGWTEQAKRVWLLRPDVERPLSVDDSVWLSVFKADPAMQPPPIATGLAQNLWSNLEFLRAALDNQWGGQWRKCWLICITTCDPDVEYQDYAQWGSELDSTVPHTRAPEWRFLGFDIADAWLLSGLTNCTHISEPDFLTLRQDFGGRINRFHLFDDLDDALRFRNVSNTRCKDHAPFFTFGIYLVAQADNSKGSSERGRD